MVYKILGSIIKQGILVDIANRESNLNNLSYTDSQVDTVKQKELVKEISYLKFKLSHIQDSEYYELCENELNELHKKIGDVIA